MGLDPLLQVVDGFDDALAAGTATGRQGERYDECQTSIFTPALSSALATPKSK
jgi:hypothetical protein